MAYWQMSWVTQTARVRDAATGGAADSDAEQQLHPLKPRVNWQMPMHLDRAGTATPTTASRRAGRVWEHAPAEVAAATAREMLTKSSSVHEKQQRAHNNAHGCGAFHGARRRQTCSNTGCSSCSPRDDHEEQQRTAQSRVRPTTHVDVEPFMVPVAAEPGARPVDADKTRPGLEWEGHKAQLTAVAARRASAHPQVADVDEEQQEEEDAPRHTPLTPE